MSAGQPAVRQISDTARWAAVYRADETDRDDALFRDPFARRMAGERGEQIATALPFHRENAWSWVTRTVLFDRFIEEQVQAGADLVLNLGAGLDTRPYRMALPAELNWVEADLAGILDYKEEILGGAQPACRLERVRVDLADGGMRRELLARLAQHSRRTLVITEGLIVYLRPEMAASLARDLARFPSYQAWVTELVSPGLLKMLQGHTLPQFDESVARLQFAPANGPQFFADHGWTAARVESMLKAAAALRRAPVNLEPLASLPEDPANMGDQPWSGVCLFVRG